MLHDVTCSLSSSQYILTLRPSKSCSLSQCPAQPQPPHQPLEQIRRLQRGWRSMHVPTWNSVYSPSWIHFEWSAWGKHYEKAGTTVRHSKLCFGGYCMLLFFVVFHWGRAWKGQKRDTVVGYVKYSTNLVCVWDTLIPDTKSWRFMSSWLIKRLCLCVDSISSWFVSKDIFANKWNPWSLT